MKILDTIISYGNYCKNKRERNLNIDQELAECPFNIKLGQTQTINELSMLTSIVGLKENNTCIYV